MDTHITLNILMNKKMKALLKFRNDYLEVEEYFPTENDYINFNFVKGVKYFRTEEGETYEESEFDFNYEKPSKYNCLFINDDNDVYGQVHIDNAEKTIKMLSEQYPNIPWRIDKHKYLFCPNPTKDLYGRTQYNNPNTLLCDKYVWITCADKESEAIITDDRKLIVDIDLINF